MCPDAELERKIAANHAKLDAIEKDERIGCVGGVLGLALSAAVLYFLLSIVARSCGFTQATG
jgi:hypothetical protein